MLGRHYPVHVQIATQQLLVNATTDRNTQTEEAPRATACADVHVDASYDRTSRLRLLCISERYGRAAGPLWTDVQVLAGWSPGERTALLREHRPKDFPPERNECEKAPLFA